MMVLFSLVKLMYFWKSIQTGLNVTFLTYFVFSFKIHLWKLLPAL